MTKLGKWVSVVLVTGLVGTVAAQGPGAAEKPAAVVNGEPIAIAEVRAILEQRPSPVPLPEAEKRAMRQAALDMLIEDALMRQFLRKSAPPADPIAVNKEIAELQEALKKQNMNLAEFLKKGQQTEAQLRSDIAARVQWKTYLTGRLPEANVKAYYDTNKVFFDKVLVKASHILVKLNGNAPAAEKQAALAKIQAIRQEIVAGKIKFDDAARRYSDCPSKDKGGDLGPFPYKFVVVEPFAKAAFALQKGQMSDVVQTTFGLHLIWVTDRTPGESSNYEATKDLVREVYAQDLELYQNILAEQRKTARIDVYLQ
jgi:parvulin-like peptidyl-prolyl isomerase